MSFVRPEARAMVLRWREVLCGAGLILIGLWWILGAGGLLAWVGGVLILGGAALALIGFQRARFRRQGGGPGVVQVDEGQITYFGPLGGGTVAIADLTRLSLDTRGMPDHWMLEQNGAAPILIPVNAEGSDALFDVFAALPGLRTAHMLAQLRARPACPVVIWQRASPVPEHQRLH
ncbi:hypothetical protein I5535_03935 [Rhodobacteraceae bacterium F11138]|nr:hypothetical protein [Rhodobacteraceae bacterium F11138]